MTVDPFDDDRDDDPDGDDLDGEGREPGEGDPGLAEIVAPDRSPAAALEPRPERKNEDNLEHAIDVILENMTSDEAIDALKRTPYKDRAQAVKFLASAYASKRLAGAGGGSGGGYERLIFAIRERWQS